MSRSRSTSLFAVLFLLLSSWIPAFAAKDSTLYKDAIRGDLDAVREYVRQEKNLKRTDASGRLLVHWLARFGHDDAVRIWLEAGGDVDFPVSRKNATGSRRKKLLADSRMDGATPLFVAASAGRPVVSRLLIEHGADVNARTADGSTPLIAAARRGAHLVAEQLLENGADVNHADRDGITPLLAVGQGPVGIDALRGLLEERELDWFHTMDFSPDRAELAGLLIEKGADAGAKTPEGETLLYLAARHGYDEIVATMLEAGVPPDQVTLEGRTPALIAASYDHVHVADQLIRAGARPVIARELVRDIHGTAVLHDCAARYHEQQGDRQEAFENFTIAADSFDNAAEEFRRVARLRQKKVARKEATDRLLNAILDASLAMSSRIRMQETVKMAALRDAVNSGTGLGGYYAALDKRYREYAALPWSEATVSGLGNLSMDQRLTDSEWIPILAKRSLMARHAAEQIRRHLKEDYADLQLPRTGDPVEELLIRTKEAWREGALAAISDDYRLDATRPQATFLEAYGPKVRSTVERAIAMKPLEDGEFLVAYLADSYLLTNRNFYVTAGTPRVIPLDRIVKYKVKISAMDLMIELNDGERILFPELKRFPGMKILETLNPAINRRGKNG